MAQTYFPARYFLILVPCSLGCCYETSTPSAGKVTLIVTLRVNVLVACIRFTLFQVLENLRALIPSPTHLELHVNLADRHASPNIIADYAIILHTLLNKQINCKQRGNLRIYLQTMECIFLQWVIMDKYDNCKLV